MLQIPSILRLIIPMAGKVAMDNLIDLINAQTMVMKYLHSGEEIKRSIQKDHSLVKGDNKDVATGFEERWV